MLLLNQLLLLLGDLVRDSISKVAMDVSPGPSSPEPAHPNPDLHTMETNHGELGGSGRTSVPEHILPLWVPTLPS